MTLREQLQALREQGGSGNRLVIQGRAAWLVVHGRRGHTELRVQAATSHYLPSKLGLDQVHRLRAAGFSMPSGHKALSWSTEGEAEELEVRLLGLLEDVYGEGETETRLTLGEADLTRNEAVERAIRKVAETKSEQDRHGLYRALLNATLLLPVDEADAAKSFGQLASWETYAVFTDAAAVERFEPRGVVVRHVGGRDLFPQLMGAELRAGSLLVNPGGQLGGELYRNELETLAKAVRRRR
jgi:hypothetical protein